MTPLKGQVFETTKLGVLFGSHREIDRKGRDGNLRANSLLHVYIGIDRRWGVNSFITLLHL